MPAIVPELLAGIIAAVGGIAGATGVVVAAGMLGVAAEEAAAGIAGAAPPAAAMLFELLLLGGEESGALADVGATDVAGCAGDAGLLAAGESALGIELSPQPIATKKQMNVSLLDMSHLEVLLGQCKSYPLTAACVVRISHMRIARRSANRNEALRAATLRFAAGFSCEVYCSISETLITTRPG